MNTKRTSLVGLFLLGLLAGCTSDWDPGRRASLVDAPRAGERSSPAATAAPRAFSFAALPDRGELLAYDRSRAVRQRGAYTSHPIRLSEEHAFRASQTGGELVVAAPDGEMIRLRYERHVEHPDGNWTWIGRTADGTDAVLTFGEKAVFGTIPYRDQEPLRVTTMAGGAWLVATDRSRLPDINRATTRTGKPDYLVPPTLSASLASSASDIGMAAAQDVSAAAASNTVDVVLGYTNGYAAALGGASQAVTRLNNLVQIANLAMTNSLVSRQVRLVRTVQVTYADATNNTTALEELTGYRSGTGEIPVPAALQPLRTARDQYGGDLVALVRDFRAPENDGCGIAWLIGGGQTAYNTGAAPFAYSVVSDGTDVDESDGNNYFCREESLAHEMGHNLGQAHNVQDSDQTGVHAYSYGYRETSASGFFTVMAYALADSDQVSIRYFANPAVSFAGRPTGMANASDNARSMNLTMPVAMNFRAAVVSGASVKNDIDGDGRSDLLFHNASTRQLSYRIMSGTTTVRSALISGVGAGYTIGATGDLNADGKLDLIWTSAARDLYLWAGNGTGFTSFRIGDYPAGWVLVGAGDIDGDGRSDLLFHNASLRQFSYRIMQGTTTVRSALISGVGAGYIVRATGDFNGDRKVDLIWTSAARDLYMWAGNGTGFTSFNIGGYPAGWALSGAGDIDGDGKSDLYFRNPSTHEFSYRIMNGTSVVRSALIGGTAAGYRIATSGDLNGDAKLDIVWTSDAARDLFLWTGNGNTFSGAAIGTYPSGWTVIR